MEVFLRLTQEQDEENLGLSLLWSPYERLQWVNYYNIHYVDIHYKLRDGT